MGNSIHSRVGLLHVKIVSRGEPEAGVGALTPWRAHREVEQCRIDGG